jgi:hypothetical protein
MRTKFASLILDDRKCEFDNRRILLCLLEEVLQHARYNAQPGRFEIFHVDGLGEINYDNNCS